MVLTAGPRDGCARAAFGKSPYQITRQEGRIGGHREHRIEMSRRCKLQAGLQPCQRRCDAAAQVGYDGTSKSIEACRIAIGIDEDLVRLGCDPGDHMRQQGLAAQNRKGLFLTHAR